ncbi:hypothetical protein TNCV_1809501 [Trichonephila clavipes]|nr:hypothetical protein TNCV_1809501 [Trichonephila clavipes]
MQRDDLEPRQVKRALASQHGGSSVVIGFEHVTGKRRPRVCDQDHSAAVARVFVLLYSIPVSALKQNARCERSTFGILPESSSQVIYSQFGSAIHQNDHQARRRFAEWAQNEIAVVPDFHKRILFSDEAHFWLNGYVNKQNCRIWSEANPQVYVETPLHPEKLTVWCALWAGGILLQKR